MEITSGSNDLGLQKYHLRPAEWRQLEDYKEILQVLFYSCIFNQMLTFNIRSLMHFRIFLVLKQHQLSVTLFSLSHLSSKDGRNLQRTTMTGRE